MEFQTQTGGDRADFATLIGGGLGVPHPGPRPEVLDTTTLHVELQGKNELPTAPVIVPDDFHGDIGVMRKDGELNFSRLKEDHRKALMSIMRDVRHQVSDRVGDLLDSAKKLGTGNILVHLIFGPITLQPDFPEEPYDRMFRMVQSALDRMHAAEKGPPESSFAFPTDQE